MANVKPITFTRLSDGTLLRRRPDGSFTPMRSKSRRTLIARWSDSEIEKMAASDPDHPALDDEFWRGVEGPRRKEAISIKLDQDVLEFFRKAGRGYQTRINAVLRRYMQARPRSAATPTRTLRQANRRRS
jgi:uncharacterized protein (DUF4415 family)